MLSAGRRRQPATFNFFGWIQSEAGQAVVSESYTPFALITAFREFKSTFAKQVVFIYAVLLRRRVNARKTLLAV